MAGKAITPKKGKATPKRSTVRKANKQRRRADRDGLAVPQARVSR